MKYLKYFWCHYYWCDSSDLSDRSFFILIEFIAIGLAGLFALATYTFAGMLGTFAIVFFVTSILLNFGISIPRDIAERNWVKQQDLEIKQEAERGIRELEKELAKEFYR